MVCRSHLPVRSNCTLVISSFESTHFMFIVIGISKRKISLTSGAANANHLIFWSDSFLRCFIKQKENSVWIHTVTVSPPQVKKSPGNYTTILAIGKSGEDHTEVVERFMQVVEELMEGFNCKGYLWASHPFTKNGRFFHVTSNLKCQNSPGYKEHGALTC